MADALRQHHLHDVAVEDVALGAFHRLHKRIFAELVLDDTRCSRFLLRKRHALTQLGGQLGQTRLAFDVSARLARVGVDDQEQLPGQVVDHCKLLGQQQQNVWRLQAVRFDSTRQLGLDVAYGVVTEESDKPPAKARQPRTRRSLEAGLTGAHEIERILVLRSL
jgi:hypothetical protein